MLSKEFVHQLTVNKNKLFSFALKLTKNQDDANDLMQETSYRAFKNISKFKEGSNFSAWIHIIMRNTFINEYRKEKRKHRLKSNHNKMDYYYTSNNVVYNQGESSQTLEELNQLLDRLNDDLKQSFTMRHRGYKYEEIAQQLNLPLGTVKSKVFYARKKLRALVLDAYETESFDVVLN